MKPRIFLSFLLTVALADAGGGDLPASPDTVRPPWSGARPDGHAPIGVMGDHTHGAGGLMFSYRYMFMAMQRNFIGDSDVPDAAVLADPRYMVTPTDMDMEMHMLGMMYAPTDRLTLVGMLNLVELSMHHLRMDGVRFRTESSGLGDSNLGALYRFWESPGQRAHAGLGILLPTAETDETDFIPGPGVTRLPYPMQLGSGSWGLAPSLTYLGQDANWSWGGQVSGKFYLDDNDEGYRLGNRGEITVWGARQVSSVVSASLRATASSWGNIDGRDPNLLPLPVPTVDPDLRGGSRLDLSAGINLYASGSGIRLAVEAGLPVWQDLDGPQLGVDWWSILGLQWAW